MNMPEILSTPNTMDAPKPVSTSDMKATPSAINTSRLKSQMLVNILLKQNRAKGEDPLEYAVPTIQRCPISMKFFLQDGGHSETSPGTPDS